MAYRKAKNGGWIMIELVVAITLLCVITTCLALSISLFRNLNAMELGKQRCIGAARAELDSMTATGRPIGNEDIQRLWPGVNVAVEKSGGQGQWEGLTLVRVSAACRCKRRDITVTMSRYTGAAEQWK